MSMQGNWAKQSIGMVVAILLLSGCVVETSNVTLSRNKNMDKAVEAYIAVGMIYLKEGDLNTAYRKFEKALSLKPRNPEANNALALFYAADNEPKEAEKHYQNAIKENATYSVARNNYASFLFDQQRFIEARDQLLLVVKDYGYLDRTKSLESLAYCYLKLNDTENAEFYFRKTLKRDARMGRSTLELATIYFKQGKYKRTERYLASFDQLSAPNARHLWLAIRLQRILKDKDKLASFVLVLKNIFPDSMEYKAYLESSPKLSKR